MSSKVSVVVEEELAFLDRLYSESEALEAKIKGLSTFLDTDTIIVTPFQDKMLHKQLFYMKRYAECLNLRVDDLADIDAGM